MFKRRVLIFLLFVMIFRMSLDGHEFRMKCTPDLEKQNVYRCGSGKRKPEYLESGELYSPVRTPIYTALFYLYPDTLDAHRGVDIIGGDEILAATAGIVVERCAGYCDGPYGQYVIVHHSQSLYTLYAHMRRVDVEMGAYVERENQDVGTVIGLMGNTGYSFGTHLHFEVRTNQSHQYEYRVDPLKYLKVHISECSNMFGVVDALQDGGVYRQWYSIDEKGYIIVN